MAVWLAAIGLYGVVAFALVRRTQEIGIRMALGATRRDVVRLVIRQGALPLAIGVAVGSTAAFVAARATAGVLFGIDASDALAWGGAWFVLVAVGVAAHAAPALRAVRIRPVIRAAGGVTARSLRRRRRGILQERLAGIGDRRRRLSGWPEESRGSP